MRKPSQIHGFMQEKKFFQMEIGTDYFSWKSLFETCKQSHTGDTSVQCYEAVAEILGRTRSIHQTVLCCCNLYANECILLAHILILCNQCNRMLMNNGYVYVLWAAYRSVRDIYVFSLCCASATHGCCNLPVLANVYTIHIHYNLWYSLIYESCKSRRDFAMILLLTALSRHTASIVFTKIVV